MNESHFIMLRKRSLTQKDTRCVTPSIWPSGEMNWSVVVEDKGGWGRAQRTSGVMEIFHIIHNLRGNQKTVHMC